MKAKDWQVLFNTEKKTALVFLDEVPWWTYVLGCLADTRLPAIRIPFLKKIRIVRDNEETTVAEWYGETLDDFWHLWVTYPSFDFAWRHIKTFVIDVDYDTAVDEFPDEYTQALARALAEAEEDLPSDEWIDANIAEVCSEEEEA